MTAAVETIELTKTFGEVTAVSDLNVRIEPGEVFGFLGPNGAGKSTTIRILLSLHRPTSGRATLLGRDVETESVEVHRRVGYVPGDLALYARFTGGQHLSWFSRLRGGTDRSYVDDLVRRLQVDVDRPVRQLSKGNRQKIGLVLAFMHRPELLVLDEPTSGLDPLMEHEFERLIRETADEGRTVLLSSHELDEVQRVSDRVGIIRAGKLVALGTVDGLRSAAPQKVEVRFREPLNPTTLAAVPGVTVTSADGPQIALDVVGEIGPLLRVIADHDPVSLNSRVADLDELFLDYYQDGQQAKDRRVH